MSDAPSYRSYDHNDSTAPLAVLASYFEACGCPYEQLGDEEIVASMQGAWRSYEIHVIWREDDRALQILAFPDISAPQDKRTILYETLALINEQVWLGHFEIWAASGAVLYRNGCVLSAEQILLLDSVEVLVSTAVSECDRFYPMFQFVLWADKTPNEALAASLIETQGEA